MQIINVVGGSLPLPQYLYPTQLTGDPVDVATPYINLPAGAAISLPVASAQYFVNLGNYSVLQYLDPVSNTWKGITAQRSGKLHVPSDGVTRRIANLTGCPVAAVVVNGGSNFSQATAAITPNVGGSTWQPIVGGTLSLTSIVSGGSGYTVPPMLLIPEPPAAIGGNVGGVPATAYATLTGTSVTGVTFSNIGAGYPTAPAVTVVPSPYDPNLGAITNATITLGIIAANQGKITAALCTNNGAPLATISALTLTAAGGAGSGATITPQVLQTVTGSSVVAGGVAWGTATAFPKVMSVGGFSTAVEGIANPVADLAGYRVRPIEAFGTTNAGGTITGVTLNDTGLFLNVPTAAIASGGTVPTGAASVTFTTGSSFDTITLQPL